MRARGDAPSSRKEGEERMLGNVFSKALWLAKVTSMVFGLIVMLAVADKEVRS